MYHLYVLVTCVCSSYMYKLYVLVVYNLYVLVVRTSSIY